MYIVVTDKVAEVFVEGNEIPIIRQPYFPNGDPFISDEEAYSWAEQQIEYMTDPTSLCPQSERGGERKPRLTEDELRIGRIRATGVMDGDLEWLVRQEIKKMREEGIPVDGENPSDTTPTEE
jgi:hypothetical protein